MSLRPSSIVALAVATLAFAATGCIELEDIDNFLDTGPRADAGPDADRADTGAGQTDTGVADRDTSTSGGDTGMQTDTGDPRADRRLRQRLDEVVYEEMIEQNLPGMAVGVVRNGQVFHEKGYGYVDRDSEETVDTSTMFRWASLSKPLTATLAMMLVDKGKLDLDKAITHYLDGYRLVDVDGFSHDGNLRFTGAWRDNDERGWAVFRNMTSAQFSQKFQQLGDKTKWRMDDIDGYTHDGNLRFSGIWVRNREGLDWREHRNLTSQQFGAKFNTYGKNDWIMQDVEAYSHNGNLYFAGIWHENKDGRDWKEHRNLSSSQFSNLYNQYKVNYRMIDVEAYRHNGTLYWAGIWVENTENLAWAEFRKLTNSQFVAKLDQLKGTHRLIDVESYGAGGTRYFAGIWVENDTGERWAVYRNMTSQQFRHTYDTLKAFPDKGITMRHLLANESGLPDYDDFSWKAARDKWYGDAKNGEWAPMRSASIVRDEDTLFTPGTRYHYTTFGFNVAGAVIDAIGRDAYGKGYVQLVDDWIADPLGMSSLQPDYSEFEDISGRVSGYELTCEAAVDHEATTDVSWKLPGGGWISNIRDLNRFMQALINGELVSSSSETAMWTPSGTREFNGTSSDTSAYGLGFRSYFSGMNREIHHGGSQNNARTYLRFYPQRQLGVVLMSNGTHFDRHRLWEKLIDQMGVSRSWEAHSTWETMDCDEPASNSGSCKSDGKKSSRLFAGVWRDDSRSHVLRRRLDTADFNLEWRWMGQRGYILVDIETYEQDGRRLWDGVFRKDNKRNGLYRNHTTSQFKAKWDQMNNDGMRLLDIETYTHNGTRYWAGVFIEGTQKAAMFRNQTTSQFGTKWTELSVDDDYKLVDIETYEHDGTRYWAGVWLGTRGSNAALFRNHTTSEFGAKRAEMRGMGNRLIDVETYTHNNTRYWAGVWEKASDGEALFRNWELCGFLEKHEAQVSNGRQLVDFETY